MSRRQGRGGKQQRRERRRAVDRLSPVTASGAMSAIPQALPSAEALASGRVVTLTQPSARAVASYANTANALQAQQARRASQITQPGVMTSPEKQYPAMPKIARKTPLLESMGAPGTAIFQGIITNDDYNPDFYWRDAIEIYDQMVRNDGQIMAIVQQLELPIRRATWTVEPFSDKPRDKEVASFIESCLFHDLVRTTADGRRIHQKWDDILRHALMMLRYGFAAFEKVWRKEDGWVKLAQLMPLLPMSVYRWWVGQDTELVGIQQYTFKGYTYCFVDIPADKILLFTHRMEGQNFQGFSLLRAAYKHWYYKDQFYKIDAIGLERNAIAVPYIELPQSFNGEDVSQAQAILANLRANESMGVTLPFGWKIGYIPNSEHYQGHALKSIEHHDVMIARSVLAQFINLGSTETGTYNLAVDQRQDLMESLQAEAEYIEDTFSADLIPQLVDFNFADVEGYPRIKCSKLAQADITELTEAISKLKARNANFLTPDPELEDWVRDQFGMPKASKSLIAAANPTAPTTPGRPDAQPGQPSDHADAESAPVEGKKAPPSPGADDGGASGGAADGGDSGGGAQAHERRAGVALADVAVKHSGVMVALMLPTDVAKRLAWPGGEPASELHVTLAFLGERDDLTPRQQATLKRVVATYVADREPLTARITGVGSFPPGPQSEGKMPIYAKVAIPGIQQWHAGLVKALKRAGLPVDETFPNYTPHITLKYATEDEPLPPPHKVNESIKGLRFTLRTVTCAIGDERTDIALGKEQGFTASEERSELVSETRALREALSIIAGMDATERGLSSVEAAERLASMTLFNPNHDAHNGQFTSGSGGGGYTSHHWEAKSTWGNWSKSHKGQTGVVDAHGGKATLTIKNGHGQESHHIIEADHEYGGYKATHVESGKVEHGMSLKGANDYIKGEIGGPVSAKGTTLLKGGKVLDASMLEAPGAKPSAAQKAINKANEQKALAHTEFEHASGHGAKSAVVYTNSSHSVEYHHPDGSMTRVTRNADDKTYTVEHFAAKPNADAAPAESWWNTKQSNGGEHSHEDKPSSVKVYKTEKGVQGALTKAGVANQFEGKYLLTHAPAPVYSSTTIAGVSPHSTTGWKAAMQSNVSGGKVIAEAGPGAHIGEYDIQHGSTKINIRTSETDGTTTLRYTKAGGKVETVKGLSGDEAKADMVAHGIKDEQAHQFVDMSREDIARYTEKSTTPEQDARIAHVAARRTALDAKFGTYSDAAARAQVQQIYKQYPEVRAAVTSHLSGGAHLQDTSVAAQVKGKGLSKADKLAQAREGLKQMHEVNEWSLLHQSNVTREGTIRLFHGTNGNSGPSVWKQRMESSAQRRGTPMTDRWSVARQFADAGAHGRLVISAHVPVEAISVWHGIRGDSLYPHEREFTLGTGSIKNHSIINLNSLKH